QSQTGPRLVGLGPKPISLNNLKTTPKPAPKITKEPSKENKADLRNALASVMNSKDKNVSEQKEEKNLDYKPFSGAHGRPFKKWSDGNSNENSKNNPSAGGKEKITDETTAKKEVPKDVLENMLDVEGEDKQS
ncbi:MAG: hypothetical protein ACE5F2_03010, partial [Candidatus Paceibacteria bacterium]